MRLHEFEEVVDRALEGLPEWVIEQIDNLAVIVEEEPPPEQGDVLGIYEGLALDERENYSGVMPDRIIVFRRPHLALGLERSELEEEIRKTVMHEIAHHLGIGDDRLEELGWG